jgi:Tol biopolymer transport system component
VATDGEQPPVQLTEQPRRIDGDPAWSPDGRQIAFRRGAGIDAEIYLMNADGTNERLLATGPGPDSDPTWSPDGGRIAFVSARPVDDDQDRHVWVVGADGSDQGPLLEGTDGKMWFSQAWSRR